MNTIFDKENQAWHYEKTSFEMFLQADIQIIQGVKASSLCKRTEDTYSTAHLRTAAAGCLPPQELH